MTESLFDADADLVGAVPVVDLVGRDVTGRRAKVGEAWADGSRGPLWRTLIRVERRMERAGGRQRPKEPWVYWIWQAEGDWRQDCGYAGMTVAEAVRQNRCIEFVS